MPWIGLQSFGLKMIPFSVLWRVSRGKSLALHLLFEVGAFKISHVMPIGETKCPVGRAVLKVGMKLADRSNRMNAFSFA